MKELASLFPRIQNAKWRENPTDSTVIETKYIRIPIFLHIPRALEQGQICILGFIRERWPGLRKSCYISTVQPVQAENQIISVSDFSRRSITVCPREGGFLSEILQSHVAPVY